MLTFALAVSCLATSSLPWLAGLTLQVPMQYCSLQCWSIGAYLHHQPHPQLGTVFTFALSVHSFWSYFSTQHPVAYWVPTNLESLPFSVMSFCLFMLFMGFSRQEYWSGFPFPCLVDHILSELSTMTRLSWVVLYGMAHSFTERDKAVVLVINLICFLWLWF